MSNATIKNKTVSTRVTPEVSARAKENLAKQGLTVSEYIRLSLVKAANNEVRLVSFLNSTEALAAKHEAENNKVTEIGSLADFDDWIDQLDED
ncbi:type II toxin-antitoxin system RelB/DinJ family antitoxin [Lactobacillus sp. DCY120]|uniref:Type II toxin-antitoxin system RelB/DinJ family antitoxin n=1 Tax=Bombilactobacillus apium TaxID=2675299 RepID=A0A850R0N0_9LACO|nr:type II toxin-antitoxin system RelB/DinJ family antitoxin [Bombilactobacillus apium]NVY95910.1 type II toxin-antitoxin system RelB/DinJ family antitoxin [Bombilactobacillus apium]